MSIADAILTQIQQAGQPRTITSKETVTAKEPIDIGGLGLLLYMLMEGMKKGPVEAPMVGEMPGSFGQLQGMGDIMPSFGAPASPAGQAFGGMDPMQMIMQLIQGAPRAPGLGGF